MKLKSITNIAIYSALTLAFAFAVPVQAKTKSKTQTDTSSEDIEALKTTQETHGKSIATMSNQVNSVVSQFQTMSGDIGKTSKKNDEQDVVIKDSQTRLQVLEDKITLLTQQLQELRSEGLMAPKSSQLFREYKAYEKGLELVNAGQYGKAVQELEKFQQEFAKSPYVDFAQFWIGESYYLQSDYPMAIKQYQKLLSKNSKSAKSSTALYKQGMSLFLMQSFDDAKVFFTKVIRTYPASIEAIQASTQISRINHIQELQNAQKAEMQSTQ